MLVRPPRLALVWLALVAAAAAGITAWQLPGGAAAQESSPIATATRADIIVSVGGVGRIVEARASGQIVVRGGAAAPGSAGSLASAGAGGGASAPADAVFAGATGHLLRFLVAPGQGVAEGGPLALLDDGGLAAAAVYQAQIDLATARLELRQRRTSDPPRGLPPTPDELRAGAFAVRSARAKLARLLGPPRPADVSAARLDVKRAKSDLEVLRGGSPAALTRAIGSARENVRLAEQRLARILAPPHAADVTAVEADVKKAEADLEALLARLPVAEQAVSLAEQRLARLTGPPDPVALAVAMAELRKAEADLEALVRNDRTLPVTQKEIDSARAAIEAAARKLEKVLGPPDSVEVAAAQLEVKRALSELVGLTQAIAAGQKAVEAARLRRAKLLEGASPADVTAARLELKRAEAELRLLEAGPTPVALAAARQAVASARARLAQLLGPALASDVAAARFDVRKAEADLTVLRARGGPASPIEIALARLKVKAARARLASAHLTERLLTVRAPAGGTVTGLLAVPGAPVDASTPIATVADLDHLSANVDLSEFDAAPVKQGMPAVVSVDALGGKSFEGKVLFVALTGTDTGGVVTFPVKVGLERTGGMKPGMNVSVRIIVAQRRKVVQVPLEAVSRDDDDLPIVMVIDQSGEASPRRVKLGLANNKSVEIVRGLRAGERVALEETQGQGGGEEE